MLSAMVVVGKCCRAPGNIAASVGQLVGMLQWLVAFVLQLLAAVVLQLRAIHSWQLLSVVLQLVSVGGSQVWFMAGGLPASPACDLHREQSHQKEHRNRTEGACRSVRKQALPCYPAARNGRIALCDVLYRVQ